MGVRLPSEYQETEWIEAFGKQYIDTGLVLDNSGYRSETVISWNEINRRQLIGAINVGYWGLKEDGHYEIYQLSNYSAQIGRWDEVTFEVTYQKNYSYRFLTVNGNVLFNGQSSRTKPGGNICVFDIADSKLDTVGANAKIKYQRIYINDNLVRNLIPCYRKADSKPGMYDLVTKQFFTNAGTGEFVVGPDVIDSISPWLVARRRLLMYKEPELYPVGTHILSMYIGDKDGEERRNFESGYGINTSTGEYYATGSGNTYASDVYVPVSPKYTYQKSDWRLNTWCFYDKDKQYISRAPSYNNLNVQTLAKFPANVRYVRIQAYNFANQKIEITRIA